MSQKVHRALRRLAFANIDQWERQKRTPTCNPRKRWLKRVKRMWDRLPWREKSKVNLPV
jgi:hypothetical protein